MLPAAEMPPTDPPPSATPRACLPTDTDQGGDVPNGPGGGGDYARPVERGADVPHEVNEGEGNRGLPENCPAGGRGATGWPDHPPRSLNAGGEPR